MQKGVLLALQMKNRTREGDASTPRKRMQGKRNGVPEAA